MLCTAVKNYIAAAKGLPFFYVVGDDSYADTLSELSQQGLIIHRASDFCPKDDKFPSIDNIIDHFRTLDVDYKQNKHVLIGLGEFLSLRGSTVAQRELHRLANTTLGSARVVLLLRCVSSQAHSVANENPKLQQQQRVFFAENPISSLSVNSIRYSLQPNVAEGIKGLLRIMEDGAHGNCNVKTMLDFPLSTIPVTVVNSVYAAIRQVCVSFDIEESHGNETQWEQLFKALQGTKNSLDSVFAKYGFNYDFEDNLYQNCAGLEFKNWLFFIYLKKNVDAIQNGYLRWVVSVTDNFEELKDNILCGILQIQRNDVRFRSYYAERKKLVRAFPESEIAIFIHRSRIDIAESVYRYTDNTRTEKEEVIRWIATYGYVSEIEYIYPALSLYMKDYVFSCGKLSEELTLYFKEYKEQKLTSKITPAFLEKVNTYALKQPYAHLETRDSAILRIPEKQSAFLLWIDALGVEYLAYMSELARKKGLSMRTDITYSELPTITSINRGFFDIWPGPMKEKEPKLDDIKHHEQGGFIFREEDDAPIHLASELEVIDKAIERAATELAMHRCKSFVIASDHGASRLAVIRRQEEKYETDTKGEHSGRCCKIFPDADLPFAISENGYYVLADYGRFKKSRAANVEVHGGASLEEVVVPVITLTLRKQTDLIIELINKHNIRADRKVGTEFTLYISETEHPNNISILIGDDRFMAVRKDATHYQVTMPKQKRSRKQVSAEIFDGDDLIGNITFDIKGKFGEADKKDFDDFDF